MSGEGPPVPDKKPSAPEKKALKVCVRYKKKGWKEYAKFYGGHHGEAWIDLQDAYSDVDEKCVEDGFETPEGDFLTREEANVYAENANLIAGEMKTIAKKSPHGLDSNFLKREKL